MLAKLFLPLGLLGVGLAFALTSKKANAAQSPSPAQASPGRAGGAAQAGPTLDQVVQRMQAAMLTADPKVLNAVADDLEKQGFPNQAKDLRGVASELAITAAQVANIKSPAAPSPAKATPPSFFPQASPGSPNIAPIPPPAPAPAPVAPVTEFPGMVIPGSPRPSPIQNPIQNAALDNVQRTIIMLQASKKWKENRDQVSALEAQERQLGHYESFDPMKLGQPGAIDGLYGPGLAWAIAKFYQIVPPNPFYWPKNSAPALTLYKTRLLELAAADPARANEWRDAAAKARVIK